MIGAAVEVNLDGLPGPTHNFAGLSHGNVASMRHAGTVSNPRAAALQGLSKMKLLLDLGVRQAVLPPHERPDLEALRSRGFTGDDAAVLSKAAREGPHLLAACSSSSFMWAANAATVSPSADTSDGKVHFTPANLADNVHRSLEAAATGILLKTLFRDARFFVHHPALRGGTEVGDEGAANQVRLCASHGEGGIELFVFGKSAHDPSTFRPSRYPARQAREASEAVARRHRLHPHRIVFARQNPDLIDAGVFHNDVIAVGNENVFLYHALAWSDVPGVAADLRRAFSSFCRGDLHLIEVSPRTMSVENAVRTYVFNSQLVSLPAGGMALIMPAECEEDPAANRLVGEILSRKSPVRAVHHVDLRESMKNGGGPACLRLRVVLTEDERAAAHPGVFLTDALHAELTAWAERHYRDRLVPEDLADPLLLEESRAALDALTTILGLGALYRFQR